MRVLVVTVVHHPFDARVWTREIGAILDGGHHVTYAAPWSAFDTEPPATVRSIDLPRAHRWRRARALWQARRTLRTEGPHHDIVVLHNPELLLALPGLNRPATVWDVHEDVAASLVDKTYLPDLLVAPAGWLVRQIEHQAEKRLHLLLAEDGYQGRFQGSHPVVPNEPEVPDEVLLPGADRAIYLGRVSHGRGAEELLEVGRLLSSRVDLEVLGWAEPEITAALEAAARTGQVVWSGRVDNRTALERLRGATAGLSLLHDLPNYRHSRPTKVVEYMAQGVPVVTTPSPVAVEIVERHGCGIVVPFGDAKAAADAVLALAEDEELRIAMGGNGHRAALEHYDWRRSGPDFVRHLERWSAEPSAP